MWFVVLERLGVGKVRGVGSARAGYCAPGIAQEFRPCLRPPTRGPRDPARYFIPRRQRLFARFANRPSADAAVAALAAAGFAVDEVWVFEGAPGAADLDPASGGLDRCCAPPAAGAHLHTRQLRCRSHRGRRQQRRGPARRP
jgi:hypothetical protein